MLVVCDSTALFRVRRGAGENEYYEARGITGRTHLDCGGLEGQAALPTASAPARPWPVLQDRARLSPGRAAALGAASTTAGTDLPT